MEAEDRQKLLALAGPQILARVDALAADMPPVLVPRLVRLILALATEAAGRGGDAECERPGAWRRRHRRVLPGGGDARAAVPPEQT